MTWDEPNMITQMLQRMVDAGDLLESSFDKIKENVGVDRNEKEII